MGMTRGERDLLGAYALDALDPGEDAAIDALVTRDPEAAREVERLRSAATWIAATEALTPHRDVRAQLFERAQPVPQELRVYRVAVRRHQELLGSIFSDALGRTTTNGLTVGDLIVHLAAQESALAESVGVPSVVTAETDITLRTEIYVDRYGTDTARASRRGTTPPTDRCVGGRRGRHRSGTDAPSRRTALVVRTFELWTHDDDIRSALRREVQVRCARTRADVGGGRRSCRRRSPSGAGTAWDGTHRAHR